MVEAERPYRAVVLSDLHLPDADPAALALAQQIVAHVQPDVVVLNGDLVDCFALAGWPASPGRRMFAEELERAREHVADLAQWAPQASWIWLWGNHEKRFWLYLWKHAPSFWGIDAFSLADLLRVPASWTVVEPVEGYRRRGEAAAPMVTLGKLTVLHGDTLRLAGNTVNVARTVFLKLLKPVMVGHWHRAQAYWQTDFSGETTGAWAVPCLTGPRAHYDAARVMDQGLAVVWVDLDGSFDVTLVSFFARRGMLRAIVHGQVFQQPLTS